MENIFIFNKEEQETLKKMIVMRNSTVFQNIVSDFIKEKKSDYGDFNSISYFDDLDGKRLYVGGIAEDYFIELHKEV